MHIKEMESLIINLRDEVDQKNMMLEDYERSNNDSRLTERMSMNTPLITASDLSDLKSNLQSQIKKAKEFELMLDQQTMKYEMEIKKANLLLNENRKLKEQNKELQFQIDEFDEIMEEKDKQLDEYEGGLRHLENELNKKKVNQKTKTFTKSKTQLISPLAQTSIHI